MSSSGSSLPPVSLSRLLHTPLAPKPSCGSADFSFAARFNLCRRVQSRQLNSFELDVTPMFLATAITASRSNGVETRHTRTQTNSTKPPLQHTLVGDERTGKKRVQLRSVFSKQECSSHCHILQNTHYSSYREPESQSHRSQSVT